MTPLRSAKKHEKLGLVVFLIIGLATFLLGFVRIRKSIFLPFVRRNDITFKTSDQIEQERVQKLKSQDTDGDGLADYDELYVFRTSPFLADSDSDGIPDGVEVSQGTDPNCPKGTTCRSPKLGTGQTPAPAGSAIIGGSSSATGSDTGSSDVSFGSPGTGSADSTAQRELQVITDTFGDPGTLTKEQVVAKLESMSSTELRDFLTKMGIPSEALQKADDATLRSLLEQALGDLVGSNGGGAIAPEVNASANQNANSATP